MSNSWVKNHKTGLSLLEMLISLAIFAVIVFPLILLPMKASDQADQAKNGGLVQFEVQHLFAQFQNDVNYAYRFFPFSDIVTDFTSPTVTMPSNDFIFMAYWDSEHQVEERVGYQLQETGTNSHKWELLRTEIPAGEKLEDYGTNASTSLWEPVVQILSTQNYYLTGTDGSDPYFVYCQGTTCNSSISALNADSVRIQAGTDTSPVDLKFVYRNGSIALPPLYFKLATQNANTNIDLSDGQMYPFSRAIQAWSGTTDSWIAEKEASVPNSSPTVYYNTPITSATNISTPPTCNYSYGSWCSSGGNGYGALPINDFYFNYKTGNLLAVSNSVYDSTNDSAEAERGAYIFQFKPGFPSYQPYDYVAVDAAGTYPTATYQNNFPIEIHKGDAAWVPYTDMEFLSVTQDEQNNIYVLASSTTTTLAYVPGTLPIIVKRPFAGSKTALPKHDSHQRWQPEGLLACETPQIPISGFNTSPIQSSTPSACISKLPNYGLQLGKRIPYLAETQNFSGVSWLSSLLCPPAQASGPPTPSTYYWVEKFSSDGTFLSRFNISAYVQKAIGIAYDPTQPQAVQVLLEDTSGHYVIQAYDKDQNNDNYMAVSSFGESPNLASSVSGSFSGDWANVKGFDYDPLHNRYLFAFSPTSGAASVLSLDASLSGSLNSTTWIYENLPSQGTPVIGKSNLTQVVQGIAYDPLNNMIYLSTQEGSASPYAYKYYEILPNTRLEDTP